MESMPGRIICALGACVVALGVGRAADASMPTLPTGIEKAWKPYRYADAHVRECRLGIEISYATFDKSFGKDLAKTTAAAHAFVDRLNTYWTSEVMIQWTLADLIVRQTPADDRHPQGTEPGRIWGDTRALFIADRKLDFGLTVCPAMGGIGLGGGRAAAIPNTWWAFDHEGSHGFGLPHENGWPYERGPQNISNPLSIYGRIPRGFPQDPGDAPGQWYDQGETHTFSAKNIEDMRRDTANLKDLGACPRSLPPYAALDIVRIPVAATPSTRPTRLTIDVMANDHDCNNGPLWIRDFDGTTPRGVTVTRAVGGGDGGRDALTYTLPTRPAWSWHDVFTYTLVDRDGLQNRGQVLVIAETPDLITNGGFEDDTRGWEGTNAIKVPVEPARPPAGSRLCLPGIKASSVRQPVKLKPASHYRLGFFCAIPHGQKFVVSVVGKDDQDRPARTKEMTKGWLKRVFYFATGETTKGDTIIISRPGGGVGDILVDEVELRQVGPQEAEEYAKEWGKEEG